MKELQIGTMITDHTEENLYPYLDFMASLGMNCCQICRLPEEKLMANGENADTKKFIAYLEEKKIAPVSIFLNLRVRPGRSGLVPVPERASRFASCCRQMAWGAKYGVKYDSCHVGIFPEAGTEEYEAWIADMRELINFADDMGQYFLFETGPETAEDLERAITDIGKKNVGINFDPANLLIYDKTDPEVFVERLFPHIKLVHCKDARRPVDGAEYGKETVLGEGDTNFFPLLDSILARGFRGPLVIEREIPYGEARNKDLTEACAKLFALRSKYVN